MEGILSVLSYGIGTILGFVLIGALLILIIHDVTQKKHTVLRNYPVIGRFRFFFENLGEYFRPGEYSMKVTITDAVSGKSVGSLETRWFGHADAVRSNQNVDSAVSARPLSGISSPSTTSNTEMRSEATTSMRS